MPRIPSGGLPPRSGLFFSILLIGFLSVLVMWPSSAHAAGQAPLTWQRNAETRVIGYRIYYGYSSGRYRYCRDVGNRISFTLGGLKVDRPCYIAIAAYDFYDNESKVSEEISYMPQPVEVF